HVQSPFSFCVVTSVTVWNGNSSTWYAPPLVSDSVVCAGDLIAFVTEDSQLQIASVSPTGALYSYSIPLNNIYGVNATAKTDGYVAVLVEADTINLAIWSYKDVSWKTWGLDLDGIYLSVAAQGTIFYIGGTFEFSRDGCT